MPGRLTVLTALFAGLLLLVFSSRATPPSLPSTWATVGQNQSIRITLAANRFAFSADGRTLAGIASDRIMLRDIGSGATRYAFGDRGETLAGVMFSPDGAVVAGATPNGRIVVWDAQTGFRRSVLTGHDGNGS